jgi:hypothetical protein
LENTMPERICKSPHEYAGRQVEVGQRFHVEPADVELMLAMGRIEREEGDKAPGYVPRDMAAGWAGGYATREMVAQPRPKRATLQRKAA